MSLESRNKLLKKYKTNKILLISFILISVLLIILIFIGWLNNKYEALMIISFILLPITLIFVFVYLNKCIKFKKMAHNEEIITKEEIRKICFTFLKSRNFVKVKRPSGPALAIEGKEIILYIKIHKSSYSNTHYFDWNMSLKDNNVSSELNYQKPILMKTWGRFFAIDSTEMDSNKLKDKLESTYNCQVIPFLNESLKYLYDNNFLERNNPYVEEFYDYLNVNYKE